MSSFGDSARSEPRAAIRSEPQSKNEKPAVNAG